MKHVILFSGGHSSALVAIKVVEKYGKDNCILLNHDISPFVEDEDIKRFKNEVSNYLDIEITYANMNEWESKDQFDVSIKAKAFKTPNTQAICTNRMKTEPFMKWLKINFADKDCILYYGFDKIEIDRIVRRTYILGVAGYKTEYPLAQWKQTIISTNEINIIPPLKYGKFKHANCTGCLKGGSQHWYVVYCERPDIFKKAKETEKILGYAILSKDKYLKDLECEFSRMKQMGINATEHIPFQTFWSDVKKQLKSPTLFNFENFKKTCECGDY